MSEKAMDEKAYQLNKILSIACSFGRESIAEDFEFDIEIISMKRITWWFLLKTFVLESFSKKKFLELWSEFPIFLTIRNSRYIFWRFWDEHTFLIQDDVVQQEWYHFYLNHIEKNNLEPTPTFRDESLARIPNIHADNVLVSIFHKSQFKFLSSNDKVWKYF